LRRCSQRALTVVRFRIEESIPRGKINFYSDLFDLLVRRHDQWKSGFRRHRHSQLDDWKLRKAFDAICFLWKKEKLTGEFSREDLLRITALALKLIDANDSPDKVSSDISEITCLLVEDSGVIKFAHKSIQEFHAASFIKSQPDANLIVFYKSMATEWREWREELQFLDTLDHYRYVKYFIIPESLKALNLTPEQIPGNWHPDSTTTKEFISHLVERDNYVFSKVAALQVSVSRTDIADTSKKQNVIVDFSINTKRIEKSFSIKYRATTAISIFEVNNIKRILEGDESSNHINKNGLDSDAFNEVFNILKDAMRHVEEIDAHKVLFEI
jgi:hypothetical protein